MKFRLKPNSEQTHINLTLIFTFAEIRAQHKLWLNCNKNSQGSSAFSFEANVMLMFYSLRCNSKPRVLSQLLSRTNQFPKICVR